MGGNYSFSLNADATVGCDDTKEVDSASPHHAALYLRIATEHLFRCLWYLRKEGVLPTRNARNGTIDVLPTEIDVAAIQNS